MTTRLLTERARSNLVQTRNTLQIFSYFAAFIPVLIATFADPHHRIALFAAGIFNHLFHLIIH